MNQAILKAKSKTRYICQECGSTEFIQGHHETPGDDTTIAGKTFIIKSEVERIKKLGGAGPDPSEKEAGAPVDQTETP
jgi:hypothetical protein